MKKKTFHKKLSLNKKTVVNIDRIEMNIVKAGGDTLYICTGATCGACPFTLPVMTCVTELC